MRQKIKSAQEVLPTLESWRDSMNPEQIAAIELDAGPCVVQAVAGCHRKGQLLLAYDGRWIKVEDVRVGDVLMGPDSQPRRVLRLIRGEGAMVQVVPVKGKPFVVNEDHVLTLVESVSGEIRDVKARSVCNLPARKQWKLFRVGVDFRGTGEPLTVDPYFLGVLLGDGTMRGCGSIGVSKPDPEIYEEVCHQAKLWRLTVKSSGAGTTGVTHYLSSGKLLVGEPRRGRNPLTNAIRDLGLLGTERHVPFRYLRAMRNARLSVLAGLLDTDGSLSHTNGCYDFISKSKALSRDVVDLARGLGLASYIKKCRKGCQTGAVGTYWRVSISGDCDVIPCRLPRKKASLRKQKKNVLRTGFSMQPLGVEPYYGFTLDGDGRYLLADYTVTHNSGKTRAVVNRVKRLIESGVDGERILAMTFSKKAADEMNKRLKTLDVDSARIGTWHSLCLQILKEDMTVWGGWRVDERDRAKILLKDAIGYRQLKWKDADLGKLRNFIGICKARMWTWTSPEAKALAKERFGLKSSLALDAFALMQMMVETEGLLTFDDFLGFTQRHLSDESNRMRWASRWDYVIVDEYQDNSAVQNSIMEQLVREHRNLMVVGDISQCIPAGQMISTPSGPRAIETIRENDEVLAMNLEVCTISGNHGGWKLVPRKVLKVTTTRKTSAFEFDLGEYGCFRATREHVLFVDNYDPAASVRKLLEVSAASVNVGMMVPVVAKDGETVITAPVLARREVKVDDCYDMEVEGLANFVVNGVVVHNSIYAFRGASPEYIAGFEEKWQAKRIAMIRNYRSGRKIVDVANIVIRPAALRMPEEMVAECDYDGTVTITPTANHDAEASEFATWIQEHVKDGGKLSAHVCLFRLNAQSRAMEEGLIRSKIPYVLVGGITFYDRKEVRDLLGYLRVAVGREGPGAEPGEAFRRCINTPFRYLGKAFVERAMAVAGRIEHPNWPAIVRQVAEQSDMQARQQPSVESWARLIETVRDAVRLAREAEEPDEEELLHPRPDETHGVSPKSAGAPAQLLTYIVQQTNYIVNIERDEGSESVEQSHGANVRELIRVSAGFTTVDSFLDYIEATIKAANKQRRDGQAGGDRVVLMSVHRAKALEFERVWVVGCNKNVFPHARGDIEEERRLMYVAVTRAKQDLVLSYVREMATRSGIAEAFPSVFIEEIAAELGHDLGDDEDLDGEEDDDAQAHP
jgi:superfamily I DNA/RNA helicase